MKNELGLRANRSWVETSRERSGHSPTPRTAKQLDLFSTSGFRGTSPLRALALLWRRSVEQFQLADALKRSRGDTKQPRF